MKPIRINATRVARRLVRKLAKPAALWLIERQLHSSAAREADVIAARGITVPLARYERKRQVDLIARRNLVRGW